MTCAVDLTVMAMDATADAELALDVVRGGTVVSNAQGRARTGIPFVLIDLTVCMHACDIDFH